MLDCRRKGIPQAVYLKNGFIETNNILDKIEQNSLLFKKIALLNETEKERNRFIFQLSGENWTEFPDSLKEQTHLKEWHVNNTKIATIPAYIALFQELRILQLSSNQITDLPVEIGVRVHIILSHVVDYVDQNVDRNAQIKEEEEKE
uniref:Leucine-rich repeat-containing protein 2 n=1 Tax=Sphaerodactylus townsendi TaxID=933632 RepID=A0ACB8ES29_9SAUR